MSLDERTLARMATGIENRDPQTLAKLRTLERGHARIIGITGPPGAGKSTLVSALAAALRAQGKTLAILAVDPSSRKTGGAILGDRIRMQRHYGDSGIFIRSMATRGLTGGLSRATADMARLMDAAGKDYVIVETVGVGQDEVEVAGIADVTAVVLVPGMGDDVQAVKAGILEIADVFVINKADQPGADRIERELSESGWDKRIVRTVATEGTGVAELLEALSAAETPPRPPAPGPPAPVVDHLGIAVKSLAEAIPFYESLGFAVAHRETVENVRVAMLPAGDSRIELLEPMTAGSPISNFGQHHVALKVPDLRGAVERLRVSGARLLNEPRAGAGGYLYVFVHPASTGGVLLELIQESES